MLDPLRFPTNKAVPVDGLWTSSKASHGRLVRPFLCIDELLFILGTVMAHPSWRKSPDNGLKIIFYGINKTVLGWWVYPVTEAGEAVGVWTPWAHINHKDCAMETGSSHITWKLRLPKVLPTKTALDEFKGTMPCNYSSTSILNSYSLKMVNHFALKMAKSPWSMETQNKNNIWKHIQFEKNLVLVRLIFVCFSHLLEVVFFFQVMTNKLFIAPLVYKHV